METKNTQSHENRRLSLIESLHMQHYCLRGCIRPPSAGLTGIRNHSYAVTNLTFGLHLTEYFCRQGRAVNLLHQRAVFKTDPEKCCPLINTH